VALLLHLLLQEDQVYHLLHHLQDPIKVKKK
jgi:hypothetical protein